MLCIALFAFVLIEDASAFEDPCHTNGAVVSYNITADVAAPSIPDGNPDTPLDQSPQTALHQHHCCGAHATGVPVGEGVPTPLVTLSALVIPYPDQFALSADPSGLDRPPRPSALV